MTDIYNSIEAILVEDKGYTYYLAVMKASQLKNICHVIKATETPDLGDGFQRDMSATRKALISSYLESAGMVIPTALILSASPKNNIEYDKIDKVVKFKRIDNTFIVIDGQHRLAGALDLYINKNKDSLLVVVLFDGLSRTQEAKYFHDINNNQKGLPKTLTLAMEMYFMEEDSIESKRIAIFNELSSDSTSPLFEKLVRTKSARGKISHVVFQNALDPLLDLSGFQNPLQNPDPKVRYLLVKNYLLAFEAFLTLAEGNSKRITNGVFFQAMFKIFPNVFHIASKNEDYSPEGLSKILTNIGALKFEDFEGTNKKTIKTISDEMAKRLPSSVTRITMDQLSKEEI
jgi:DGQHR domain-containing protein